VSNTIFDIGYGNRTPYELRKVLMDAGIEFVMDVRRLGSRARISPYFAGINMQRTVEPMVYKHAHAFGNWFQNLDTYAAKMKQPDMEAAIEAAAWLSNNSIMCFLCCELRAYKDGKVNCHRIYVAEAVAAKLREMTGAECKIVHL